MCLCLCIVYLQELLSKMQVDGVDQFDGFLIIMKNESREDICPGYVCGSAVTQMLRVGSVASHICAAFSGIRLTECRNVSIFQPWWTWLTGWIYICAVMHRCIVSVCIASVKWHICVGFLPRCRLTEWRNYGSVLVSWCAKNRLILTAPEHLLTAPEDL